MKKLCIGFFCLGLFHSLLGQETTPKAETSTEKVNFLAEVKVDLQAKKASFPVEFISSEQMLEVFACTEQGPTHETVLLIPSIGIKLREILQQMGLTESLHWQYPVENGFNLAMGDKVMMKIYFEGKKETDATYVEDLLVFSQTETPVFLRGWSFKGDQITIDGKTTTPDNVEFSLLDKGRKSSPITLLLNPSNFFNIDETEYKVAPAYKPYLRKLNDPNKVKATVFLTPVNEETIATENAKRYKDENGQLTKNIELAKKIDALKAQFMNVQKKSLLDSITKGSAEGISDTEKNKWVAVHQKQSFEAEATLYEINYLYHQMAQNEYNYLLSKMPAGTEETKNYKTFVVTLLGFLTKEAELKWQVKKEELLAFEANQNNQPTQKQEHEIKQSILNIKVSVQPFLFRQIALAEQIASETLRLEDKEVKDSAIIKETFEKSIARSNLDKNLFKAIQERFEKQVLYLEELLKNKGEEAKLTEENTVVIQLKTATLNVALQKLSILIFAHKDRVKSLTAYMKEDKKEEEYYKKKIDETQTQLDSAINQQTEVQKLIETQGKGVSIKEIESKYKDLLLAN